jgi:hypothetical protein
MTSQATSESSKPKALVSLWPLVIGVPLGGLGGLWLLFAANARIDSVEEYWGGLSLAPQHAAPLALASVFLVLGLTPRLRAVPRILLSVAIGVGIWFLLVQLLRYGMRVSFYSDLRSLGLDPEKVTGSGR